MSIEYWPFYPDNLTDVMGPTMLDNQLAKDLFCFIQAACAVRMKRPVAIVEKAQRLDAFVEGLNFSDFCRYFRLRNEGDEYYCPGGNERCEEWDRQKAMEILEKLRRKNLPNHVEIYECHMGLADAMAAIYVAEMPVAALYAGQFLPRGSEATARRRILDALEKLEVQTLGPQEKPLPCVSLTVETKDELRVLVQFLETAPNDFEKNLAAEAQIIGRIAQEFWERYKGSKEQEFLNVLREAAARVAEEKMSRERLSELLTERIQRICEFCGFSWMAFFADWEREGNVLDLIAYHGLPDEVREFPPHFNFHKSRIDFREIPARPLAGMPLGLILERGLRESHQDHIALLQRMRNTCSLIVPTIPANEAEKSVLLFGQPQRSYVYDLERVFLQSISDLLSDEFRHELRLARLTRSEKEYSDIAELLAHQVRNILQPIRSGMNLIITKLKDSCLFTQERAEEAAQRVATHIDYLADYSRITLGSAREAIEFAELFANEAFQKWNLAELVRRIAEGYQEEAENKGIVFQYGPGFSLPKEAEILHVPFETAIGNIIQNAVKFAREKSQITLDIVADSSAVALAKFLTVSIKNLGSGILPREKNEIFKRGIQGQIRGDHLGDGLGLYETKKIILGHQGTIECESYPLRGADQHDNWVTTFLLKVPVQQRWRN